MDEQTLASVRLIFNEIKRAKYTRGTPRPQADEPSAPSASQFIEAYKLRKTLGNKF